MARRANRLCRGHPCLAQQTLRFQCSFALLLFFRVHLGGLPDFDGGAEPFIVLVSNRQADMHVLARLEAQDVVSSRVSRKPVVAFDVFAKGFEQWKRAVLLLFHQTRALSTSFDNLKIPIFNPNAAL